MVVLDFVVKGGDSSISAPKVCNVALSSVSIDSKDYKDHMCMYKPHIFP